MYASTLLWKEKTKVNHPDQKKYALLSAVTGLTAIALALAAPACTNGTAANETSNLTGPQIKTQRQCDNHRKLLKQQFVIQHRLAELKNQIESITINTSKEERDELANQSNIAASALTEEAERKKAITKFQEIQHNVAARIHSDLEHPKALEGTKLKFEHSTFTLKEKALFGLAIRQTYDHPSQHENVHAVILFTHPKEVRTLIFVEKEEGHDMTLMSYVNQQLPENCAGLPSKLDEYLFNTLHDGLKL